MERYKVFSPNVGKYRPETTPYLGTFRAVILNENKLLEAVHKIALLCQSLKPLENEMLAKRKIFILKTFWSQVHNIYIAGFFRIATFPYNFYRLLENIQCFYHLPKLKAIRLKVSVMKNVYKFYKPLK